MPALPATNEASQFRRSGHSHSARTGHLTLAIQRLRSRRSAHDVTGTSRGPGGSLEGEEHDYERHPDHGQIQSNGVRSEDFVNPVLFRPTLPGFALIYLTVGNAYRSVRDHALSHAPRDKLQA
jgi:hypothetical protein